MKNISIVILEGQRKGEILPLTAEVTKFGRSSRNDIKIADEKASRYHAEIRIVSGVATLIDLHSSNGTLLNGEPIQIAQLRNGDIITIGDTTMQFSDPAEPLENDSDLVMQVSRDYESDELLPEDFRTSYGQGPGAGDGSPHRSSGNDPGSARAPQVIAKAKPRLQLIVETLDTIRQTSDEGTLMTQVLQRALEFTGADRGCVLLHCRDTSDYLPLATLQRGTASETESRLRISETIIKFVTESRQSVLTNDAQADQRWNESENVVQPGTREAICAPLIGRQGILGLIYLDTYLAMRPASPSKLPARFTQEHLEIVTAVAQQVAMALELSRYYQALLESERLAAVGQVTASMSHNIKNNMQGIISGAYLVENGIKNRCWETLERGWKIVNELQESCFSSFLNVLNYSAPKTPSRTLIDLVHLLQRTQNNLHHYANRHGVELVIEADSFDQAKVYIDEHGILQAIANLVMNAVDACQGRPNPRVTIGAAIRPNGALEIRVRDNGTGVPEPIRPQLFRQFVSTKGHLGTGLGLMSVRKIAEEHGGTITFESVESVGTVFTLTIPALPPTEENPSTASGDTR